MFAQIQDSYSEVFHDCLECVFSVLSGFPRVALCTSHSSHYFTNFALCNLVLKPVMPN